MKTHAKLMAPVAPEELMQRCNQSQGSRRVGVGVNLDDETEDDEDIVHLLEILDLLDLDR